MAEADPNPRTAGDDSAIQGRNWLSAQVEKYLARWTPPCSRVVRIVSDSLDRPLGLGTRLSLRAHSLICCHCRRYGEQVHLLRRFTRALPGQIDEIPIDRLDELVKGRIKKRLRDSS